jgi:Zn-dependent peptidase ImmA (M78 family)
VTLPRGFKAEAERIALRLRSEAGVGPTERLDITQIATNVGAEVIAADELISLDRLAELERLQTFAFSACTFEVHGKPVIVFNPLRRPERQASDIAHELAHVILEHDLSQIEYLDGVPFRTCLPDQEEQATAFGGTLLLPRSLLLGAAKRGTPLDELAIEMGVTVEMARYRWNTTGIARQVANRRQQ